MGRRPMPRQRGLFVKSPLWNPEKQRLTFIVWFFIVCSQGIKRPAYMPPTRLRLQAAISCIHGAPPQTPPKGTFCKKSPLESRKTTFDFYCLGFTDRSQGIKRPAYMPPTRLRRRDALDQRIARLTRKTWPSAASGYQAMFAPKVSKITVHAADF